MIKKRGRSNVLVLVPPEDLEGNLDQKSARNVGKFCLLNDFRTAMYLTNILGGRIGADRSLLVYGVGPSKTQFEVIAQSTFSGGATNGLTFSVSLSLSRSLSLYLSLSLSLSLSSRSLSLSLSAGV